MAIMRLNLALSRVQNGREEFFLWFRPHQSRFCHDPSFAGSLTAWTGGIDLSLVQGLIPWTG